MAPYVAINIKQSFIVWTEKVKASSINHWVNNNAGKIKMFIILQNKQFVSFTGL